MDSGNKKSSLTKERCLKNILSLSAPSSYSRCRPVSDLCILFEEQMQNEVFASLQNEVLYWGRALYTLVSC
jgi:hypothetical protein